VENLFGIPQLINLPEEPNKAIKALQTWLGGPWNWLGRLIGPIFELIPFSQKEGFITAFNFPFPL